MENMTFEQVQTVVKTMAKVAKDNEAYFCELDGVMGDADFGVSLATGFQSVMDKWDTYDMSTIGSFRHHKLYRRLFRSGLGNTFYEKRYDV